MKKLSIIPYGLKAIIEYYGNPNDPFFERLLSLFQLPFALKTSWDFQPVTMVRCHKLVGEAFVDALYEIKTIAGESFLRKYELDLFGGSYNNRTKINSTDISTHAWGIAFDMCPNYGPYGEPSRLPWWFVEAFTKRGFINIWQSDGMHFQACGGY